MKFTHTLIVTGALLLGVTSGLSAYEASMSPLESHVVDLATLDPTYEAESTNLISSEMLGKRHCSWTDPRCH